MVHHAALWWRGTPPCQRQCRRSQCHDNPDDLTEEFCTSLLSAPVLPSAIDDFHAPRVISASPPWLLQKQIWVMPSVRCSELGGGQTSEKSDGDPRRCTHLPDTCPTPLATCKCVEVEKEKGEKGKRNLPVPVRQLFGKSMPDVLRPHVDLLDEMIQYDLIMSESKAQDRANMLID